MSEPTKTHSRQFVQVPVAVLAGEVERQGVRSRLSFGARIVWAALKLHAWGEKQSCYPSIKRLAEFLGTTPRWITHLLTELEHAGRVIRETRPGKTTIYHLTDPSGPPNDHSGVDSDPRTIVHHTPEQSFTTPLNDHSPESDLKKQTKRNTPSASPPGGPEVDKSKDGNRIPKFFNDQWERTHPGQELHMKKRHATALQQMTKDYGPDLMEKAILLHLQSTERFVVKKGHDVTSLEGNIVGYVNELSSHQRPQSSGFPDHLFINDNPQPGFPDLSNIPGLPK